MITDLSSVTLDMEGAADDPRGFGRRKEFHREGDFLSIVGYWILPGKSIGEETHPDAVQSVYVVSGYVRAQVGKYESSGGRTTHFVVPAGTKHTIHNPGEDKAELLVHYVRVPGRAKYFDAADGFFSSWAL